MTPTTTYQPTDTQYYPAGYPPIYTPAAQETFHTPENIPAPVEQQPKVYTVRDLAQEYQRMGKLAEELLQREDVYKKVDDRLDHLGNELKKMGGEPIAFKAQVLEPLKVDRNFSLEESDNLLRHQKNLLEKGIKGGLGNQHEIKQQIEKQRFINDNYNRLIQPQAPARHYHTHHTPAPKPNHHYHHHTPVHHHSTNDQRATNAAVAIAVGILAVCVFPQFVVTSAAVLGTLVVLRGLSK